MNRNDGVSLIDRKRQIYFVGFNQDGTSLAIGTSEGYKIFEIVSVNKLELLYENTTEKNVCIIERLFSSALVVVVSLNTHRNLRLYHFKNDHQICERNFGTSILAVRLNRTRLVVCLEESLSILDLPHLNVKHVISGTPLNSRGICCLVAAPDARNCYFAYPGSSISGEVMVFDAQNLNAVTMIPAHDSPLACISFDFEGKRLATSSEKGTVIRVFGLTSKDLGDVLFEFRRGITRCADIYCLSFSPKRDDKDASPLLLTSSSNTKTTHVFKLERPMVELPAWKSYLGTAFGNIADYLPRKVVDMSNQERSYAVGRHSFTGVRTISAIAKLEQTNVLLVASADGDLCIYAINPDQEGNCKLLKCHKPLTPAPAKMSVAEVEMPFEQPHSVSLALSEPQPV